MYNEKYTMMIGNKITSMFTSFLSGQSICQSVTEIQTDNKMVGWWSRFHGGTAKDETDP